MGHGPTPVLLGSSLWEGGGRAERRQDSWALRRSQEWASRTPGCCWASPAPCFSLPMRLPGIRPAGGSAQGLMGIKQSGWIPVAPSLPSPLPQTDRHLHCWHPGEKKPLYSQPPKGHGTKERPRNHSRDWRLLTTPHKSSRPQHPCRGAHSTPGPTQLMGQGQQSSM